MSSDEARTPATPADAPPVPEDRVPSAPTPVDGHPSSGSAEGLGSRPEDAAPQRGGAGAGPGVAVPLPEGAPGQPEDAAPGPAGGSPRSESAAPARKVVLDKPAVADAADVGRVRLDKPATADRADPAAASASRPWAGPGTSEAPAGQQPAWAPPPATGPAAPGPLASPGNETAPPAPAAHAPNPFAPPSDEAPLPAPAAPAPSPFAPSAAAPYPAAQGTAPGNPFAAPSDETPFPASAPHAAHSSPAPIPGHFVPPAPAGHTLHTHVPGAPGGLPFAAPGPGVPVPPPPISPDGPGQFPYVYPQYPGVGPGAVGHPFASGYGWPLLPPPPSNSMGIASMVLGICAVTLFCMWPLAILLGVMAVIFGILGRAKASRGEATNPGHALAGIICGIAGFLMGIGFFVLILVAPDATDDSDPGVFDDSYDTSLSLVLPAQSAPPPLARPAVPGR